MRPRIKPKAISNKNTFKKISKEIDADLHAALVENQILRRKSKKISESN